MGSLEGVYSTRSAWAGHHEVVHVTYDPEVIDYSRLLTSARRMRCASVVYTFDEEQYQIADRAGVSSIVEWKPSLETRRVRKSEQKYHLRNTALAYLPLNELQAVKLNVLASSRFRGGQSEAAKLLSPRQRALMGRISTAISEDRGALSGLSFPVDQEGLVTYQKALLDRLEEVEQ